MLRIAAGVSACLAFLFIPDSLFALSLTSSAQLGVSRAPGGPGERWTVWARRSDGVLVSRHDNTSAGFVWDEWTGIPSVAADGVSATGWSSGGVVYERAYFVGAGTITEARLRSNWSQQEWANWSRPPKKSLTGRVAATTTNINGVREVLLFATVTDGGLWVLRINPVTENGLWSQVETGVDTTSPMAASSSPDGSTGRVFVRKNSAVWMERVTSAGWYNPGVAVGNPPGLSGGCGTMAAAEGNIGTPYYLYLFCTKYGGTNDRLYAAVGNSVLDNTFAWIDRLSPNNEQLRNTGYALAATRRIDGNSNSIDAYVVSTQSILRFVKHTPSSPLSVLENGDLGSDGETTARYGGMAATPSGLVNPAGTGYSYGYFVGQMTTAYRLYRRVGDNSIHFPATDGRSWSNHQSADPWHAVVAVSENNHAESSTALFKGRAVTVSIRRPGGGAADMARADANWSSDDGDTWTGAAELPDNGEQYTSDPVVDFDDSGTAIAVAIGVSWDDGECKATLPDRRSIYYTTSTNGTWSPASELASNTSLDHPWVAVERNPNGPDRTHVVWNDSQVRHITKVGNGAWSAVHNLNIPNPAISTVTVGAGGVTYVVSGNRICRLNPAFDGCEVTEILAQGNCAFAFRVPFSIPGSADHLELAQPWSVHASPTNGNKLYYAFQKTETNGTELDVFLAVVNYNPFGNPRFVCNAPVQITDQVNDDRDQFEPSVTVVGLASGGSDFISVSWYDRRAPEGDCEGEENRCFRGMRSVSINSGSSFIHTEEIPMDALAGSVPTDPALLPLHCRKPNVRFLGEYHDTVGDVLHTMQVIVGVPVGTPDGGDPDDEPDSSGLFGAWVSPGFYNWVVP